MYQIIGSDNLQVLPEAPVRVSGAYYMQCFLFGWIILLVTRAIGADT